MDLVPEDIHVHEHAFKLTLRLFYYEYNGFLTLAPL